MNEVFLFACREIVALKSVNESLKSSSKSLENAYVTDEKNVIVI